MNYELLAKVFTSSAWYINMVIAGLCTIRWQLLCTFQLR